MTTEIMRKMKWKFRDGRFVGQQRFKLKPFWWFNLNMSVACGGMVVLEMRSAGYPELYWAGTFLNYKIAEESIEKRFLFLEERAAALQEQIQAVEEERKRLISTEIKRK